MKSCIVLVVLIAAFAAVVCAEKRIPDYSHGLSHHQLGRMLSAQLEGLPPRHAAQLKREICSKLDTSLFNVLSCKKEEPNPDYPKWQEIYEKRYGPLNPVKKADKKEGDCTDALNPVLLFPGLAGSGLQAQLHKNDTPAWYCFKNSDWFNIWLAIYEGLAQKCWFDNLAVFYNPANNTYSNHDGVDIRPRDFGGLTGIDYLDVTDDILHLTGYYHVVIEGLVHAGYEAGENLFGVPYDWRMPVDYLMTQQGYEARILDLIETAYHKCEKPVYLVTHSMGGPTALWFLNHQGEAWKEKYIAGYVPIAFPGSGAPKALRAMISGDNFGLEVFGVSLINRELLMGIARESGGVGYLVPDSKYWPADKVFVHTPDANYTTADFENMMTKLGSPDSAAMLAKVDPLMNELVHPNVTTYCLFGTDSPTEIEYGYAHLDPHWAPPDEIDDSDLGDGTVPLQSLKVCKDWITEDAPVECKEYDLRNHSGILKDDELIADLVAIVKNQDPIEGCNTPRYDEGRRLGLIP